MTERITAEEAAALRAHPPKTGTRVTRAVVDEAMRKGSNAEPSELPSPYGPAEWTPDHYRGDGLQPFDVINAFGLDFYEGNAIKYLLRWRKKNGAADLRKARTYVQILIDRAEQQADEPEPDAAVIVHHVAKSQASAPDRVDEEGPEMDTCRPVEIGGEVIRVHGGRGDMDEETRAALGEVIRAAKRKFAAENPEHDPAADEDAQRTTRRNSLRSLLARLDRGAMLAEEKDLLRGLVEDEFREADTARADRIEYARRCGDAEAQADTADLLRAEAQRDRDQHAAVLAEVLGHFTVKGHPGEPCLGSGWVPVKTVERWRSIVAPTIERPWWEQLAEEREIRQNLGRDIQGWIRLAKEHQTWGQRRWNAWKSARSRAQEQQAAIKRVHEYLEAHLDQVAVDPAEIFNLLTGAEGNGRPA